MTPKEKAFHLHFNFIRDVIADNEKAKQCALIVVDEIFNSWHPVNIHCGYEFNHDNLTTSFYEYWEQVKNEIEKL